MPSVLWRCWLGGRKGIWPVKNFVVRCWRGYLSGARCRLAYAQLMPLPLTVSRVVLEKGPLNGCVCVCMDGMEIDIYGPLPTDGCLNTGILGCFHFIHRIDLFSYWVEFFLFVEHFAWKSQLRTSRHPGVINQLQLTPYQHISNSDSCEK